MRHARRSGPEGEKEVARGRCLEIRLCHCEVTVESYCHEDKAFDVPRALAAEAELWSRGQEARSSGAGCCVHEAPGSVTGSSTRGGQ